jgi:hypothetical protein
MRMTERTTACGATWCWIVALCLACLALPILASAQTELAHVSGRVSSELLEPSMDAIRRHSRFRFKQPFIVT